jgi:hypothetical protein
LRALSLCHSLYLSLSQPCKIKSDATVVRISVSLTQVQSTNVLLNNLCIQASNAFMDSRGNALNPNWAKNQTLHLLLKVYYQLLCRVHHVKHLFPEFLTELERRDDKSICSSVEQRYDKYSEVDQGKSIGQYTIEYLAMIDSTIQNSY